MGTKIGLDERKKQAIRLREIRENSGLTQERFAEIIGISLSSYKKLESGENRISLATLKKMHDKLNVSSDFVLYDKRQDGNQVWTDILNCSEHDKMFLFIKMLQYFTELKAGIFPLKDENYDRQILELIKNHTTGEESDAAKDTDS